MSTNKFNATKTSKSTGSSNATSKSYSCDDFVAKGNDALADFQPELAAQFFRRALNVRPEDTNIMDALADSLIQCGDKISAAQLLQLSTAKEPNANPFKWCYLAQLQYGNESLLTYQKAIEILSQSNEIDVALRNKQIAKSYCSIAELYLTDLCLEVDAESFCENSIMKSLEFDPDNLDATQTLASFRLSQSRPQDAATIIEAVYNRGLKLREKMNNITIIDEMRTDSCSYLPEDYPEPDYFLNTAKLLIECSAVKPILSEMADELIADLLSHDDENVELWYLAGVALLSQKPVDHEGAKYHLERAMEMLECLQLNSIDSNETFPYREQYDLVKEHLQLLDESKKKLLVTPSVDHTNTQANSHSNMTIQDDEEWSTCDEVENDDMS